MEEIKNRDYYDKLDDKEKNRFHKLYLKYKKDEEKVIRIINYEKKMEKIQPIFGILMAIVISLSVSSSEAYKIYVSGEFSTLKGFILFICIAILMGMDVYKYLYIIKELNKKISIVFSIVAGFILGKIFVSIFESIFYYFIVNFMLE